MFVQPVLPPIFEVCAHSHDILTLSCDDRLSNSAHLRHRERQLKQDSLDTETEIGVEQPGNLESHSKG